MPELTDEQREAVELRDGSLLVRAGAGAGKTSVLVERFVRAVIEDEVPVDGILAITFTEKAAAEMRRRVRRRLLELGCRDAAREAEQAWISTIHGFCSRVLRAHALSAGIDPEYRVLDALEAERVGLDAFDRRAGGLPRHGGDATRLEMVAAYTPDTLREMVRTVHSRLRSRGQRQPVLEPVEPPLARRRARGAGCGPPARPWPSWARHGEPGKQVCDGADGAASAARRCWSGWRAAPQPPAGRPGRAGAARAQGLGQGAQERRLPGVHGGADRLWRALRAPSASTSTTRSCASCSSSTARPTSGSSASRSGLDFEDLELVTRDLLHGEPRSASATAERFAHVLVDEFQDTNPLQNELLELLARDNLFRVGDERQSIYGFRNADVEVFRSHHAAAAAAGRARSITMNFRSRGEVLDAIDRAFEELWGERVRAAARAPGRARASRRAWTRRWSCWWSTSTRAAGTSASPARARTRSARACARPHPGAPPRRACSPGASTSSPRDGPYRYARRGAAAARHHAHGLLRARARGARHSDARRRRARLLEPAAGDRPAQLAGRAGEPARRAGALLACWPRRWSASRSTRSR